ncbi:MAG: hypothetical protein JSS98_09255 [Bacteroidetes bacterium]|nr:hypothetical protein [Bacteroidota bacterium]
MIWIGKQITSPGDTLQPVATDKIFKAICNPNGDVATLQKRLQAIRMIDQNQYRKLKTGLPYMVCAHFQPRIRRKENFIYTERFIVDIDHLSEYELNLRDLKTKLCQDSRIELMFTSPGGDGLKLLFVLKDRISDSGYYALFYKSFCLKLTEQYALAGAIDTKTNDVSRCCFVSFDPEAYYNENAERVIAPEYLPEEGAINFDQIKASIRNKEKEMEEEKKELGIEPEVSAPLTDDILIRIKEKIGMKVRRPIEKTYCQPAELDIIIPEVMQQLESVGISLVKMRPIDYGRQIRVSAGSYWAEINIFYGQRGASVVGTTKTGSNKGLCENVVALLKSHFQQG